MPFFRKEKPAPLSPPKAELPPKLTDSLRENLLRMYTKADNTSDLNVRTLQIQGISLSMIVIDGMVNLQLLNQMTTVPILNQHFPEDVTPKEIYTFVEEKAFISTEVIDFYDFDELFRFMMSGFMVILIDGMSQGIAIGVRGFAIRSISEPTAEMNERGSQEGFIESLGVNMTMVRRRIKSPDLKLERKTVGRVSKTDICLVYMTNIVSKKLLQEIHRKINGIDLEMVLTEGYLKQFLEGERASLFSDVGTTERPDTLCAKIQEGRVAILIDGTPFALIVPYLFSENFQSIDDYCQKPIYATFIRIIKYFSFLISILLPGMYVAISTFHPELFPEALLFNVVSSQETTPFSLMVEALLIHFMYEVMREAGLRLPRAVGHAVSIIGALVIGDAAVTAGLIGAPMILVVALTAISSFVIPSLHETISLLRFLFILVGGTFGLYGIALLGAMVMTNACALTAYGVPYLSPIAPMDPPSMRDTFIRRSFRILGKHTARIQDLNGVHINRQGGSE